MNKTEIKSMINDLQGKELSQAVFYESMTWDEYRAATEQAVGNDKELKALLMLKKQEEVIEQVALETLLQSSFAVAKQAIDQMTLAKRIDMIADLQKYRDHLYSMCNRFGNEEYTRDEQPTAKEFRVLIGRIKHLEVLQSWLFGIV